MKILFSGLEESRNFPSVMAVGLYPMEWFWVDYTCAHQQRG